MQSSCASRTDSPSRIPRLRGASNSSARKYSQSQERGRTPSLGDQPSMPKDCGGGLSVPPGRTAPHERSPLSRSARASGAAARPRTPSRQWPSRDLDFPAGAARPITSSRASSRMFTASHGTYHRHCSDKYQQMGTTRVALTLSRTVGYEVGRRVPRRSIGYRAPASPDLLAVLVTLLVRALGKWPRKSHSYLAHQDQGVVCAGRLATLTLRCCLRPLIVYLSCPGPPSCC